jgi:hypothetical protein
VVLHEPPERLRCRAAHDIQGCPVQRIEKADAVGLLAASAWFGSKSPKVVKAAILPVFVRASRLSGARPPPVLGSSEVNSKLVGVERAARVTWDTLLQVEFKLGGAILAVQQPFAVDRFGCVQVATDASRLIVDRA